MSCPWEYADPSPVENGRRLVCCMECGSLLRIPEANDPKKIQGCRWGALTSKSKHKPWLHHLGDYTAIALAQIGITKERYRKAKERLGLGSSCGCEERQEGMNQIGEAVAGKIGLQITKP